MIRGQFPLVVRERLASRLGQIAGCLIVLALAIWMSVVVVQLDDSGIWATVFLSGLFVAAGVGAIWFACYIWSLRTVFDATGVTAESIWGRRRFERAQLHGWRWGAAGSELATVELYEKGSRKPFAILVPKADDPTIAAWFEGAEDLTSAETAVSIAEIEADENLGVTPGERTKAADAEALILRRAYWPVLALTVWVLAFPRPYQLAVGIALAAPALILLFTYLKRDRVRLWEGTNKFRASTGNLIVLCVCATMLRAFYDWRVVDWFVALVAALLAGAMVAAIVLLVFGERFENRDRVLGAVFGGVAYVYGAIIPLNMWLDREPPLTLQGAVIEVGSDWVAFQAPPPFSGEMNEDISRRLSDRLVEGGPICIDLYRGAFRIRSYELRSCDVSSG